MEEFEFDLQCLQPTTVFDKPISHFSVHNESGDFKCNYQSPTYNSYQINNPIFNIFCSPNYFKNNFSNETSYEHNNNEGYENNNREFYNINIPKEERVDLKTFFCSDFFMEIPQLYYVSIKNKDKINYSSKERIIDMLEKKCREFISDEYEIEIFL